MLLDTCKKVWAPFKAAGRELHGLILMNFIEPLLFVLQFYRFHDDVLGLTLCPRGERQGWLHVAVHLNLEIYSTWR